MNQSSQMKIDIPGVDFEGMAREAIAARLTEALVGADTVIQKIVVAALTQKVNDKGVVGSSYENKTPFVEWMAHDLIRQATIDVLKARAEALKPQLEKAIDAELRKSLKTTAHALVKAFVTGASHSWNLKINVTPIER